MDILFFLLLCLVPLLWVASLVLLKGWQRFWPFFGLNAGLLVGYLWLIGFSDLVSFGHDEYGLGRLFAMLGAVLLHILLGFAFALTHHIRHRFTTLS